MDYNRLNLSPAKGRKSYLYLTILFTALSMAGIAYLVLDKKSPEIVPVADNSPAPTIIETIDDISTDSGKPLLTPTEATSTPKLSPTLKPSTTPKPTITPKLSPVSSPSAAPTKSATQYLDFKSEVDNFQVSYSAKRKLYQDTEESGNRYTFYLGTGNFAVHAGPTWSWIYPNRQFTTDLLVGNQPTFRYDIKTQTIVDFTRGEKVYTLQCVHNGIASLKTECEDFLKSFKFLQ